MRFHDGIVPNLDKEPEMNLLKRQVLVPARRDTWLFSTILGTVVGTGISTLMVAVAITAIFVPERPSRPEVVFLPAPAAPVQERPLVDETCAVTTGVVQVTISGRSEIDQPWPFREPLTVWRCQLDDGHDRLVWRHPEVTPSSFMTIPADARVTYALAVDIVDLR